MGCDVSSAYFIWEFIQSNQGFGKSCDVMGEGDTWIRGRVWEASLSTKYKHLRWIWHLLSWFERTLQILCNILATLCRFWEITFGNPTPKNCHARIYIIYPCDIIRILRRFIIYDPYPLFLSEERQQKTADKIYNFYQVYHIILFSRRGLRSGM